MHRLPRSLTLRQQQTLLRRPRQPQRIPHIHPLHSGQRRWETQLISRATGEPVRFRRVRFKKPGFFSLRRLVTIGLYTGIVYGYSKLLWRYMDIDVEFLDDEDLEEEETAAHAEGEEGTELEEGPFYADEDSLFIPMTWSTKMARQWYKGSDPEWQEFIKVAKDKARHKKVQDELVQIVYTGSTQHPSIAQRIGTDPKIGKYWLDISFPDGPPQEYERSGIEIGDGFIAWSQQKVSQENQTRLMRALWPKAAAEGSWATIKVLAKIQYRRARELLGLEAHPGGLDSPAEKMRATIEAMKKAQERQEGGQQQRGRGAGKTSMEAEGSSSTSLASSSSGQTTATPTPDQQKRLPYTFHVPLPTSSSLTTTDIPIAMHVFSATLSKNWHAKHKNLEPPRGTFVVQGLVEVRGGRGRVLFDVSSFYDPRVGKYVSVNASVRSVKGWRQGPRGGP